MFNKSNTTLKAVTNEYTGDQWLATDVAPVSGSSLIGKIVTLNSFDTVVVEAYDEDDGYFFGTNNSGKPYNFTFENVLSY